MSTLIPVEVIAEALAKHQYQGRGLCRCGWKSDTEDSFEWIPLHEAHQASVIAALPDIAIVALPEPDEQVTDRRPGFAGLTFPAWHPHGIGDIGSAAVGQHPGIVEACWSGVTMWTPEESRSVAAALLAAARAAGGES
ncbi:hypothetical protein [Rhodococcoides fascians]|uniref:hypothetical protein n=1 Tax=Rhodococcoides fascians TaxID=1828 RepID=UPI00055EE4AC|nr:hypothetical protein [Rhodococcus fascians]